MPKKIKYEFNYKDFAFDMRYCKPSTKGMWLDMFSIMIKKDTFFLDCFCTELMDITGANSDDVLCFLQDNDKYEFCNIFESEVPGSFSMSRSCHAHVTHPIFESQQYLNGSSVNESCIIPFLNLEMKFSFVCRRLLKHKINNETARLRKQKQRKNKKHFESNDSQPDFGFPQVINSKFESQAIESFLMSRSCHAHVTHPIFESELQKIVKNGVFSAISWHESCSYFIKNYLTYNPLFLSYLRSLSSKDNFIKKEEELKEKKGICKQIPQKKKDLEKNIPKVCDKSELCEKKTPKQEQDELTEKIIFLYNQTCPKRGFAKCNPQNPKSEVYKNIAARCREAAVKRKMEWWEDYFKLCISKPFLRGERVRSFKATLAFITRVTKMDRIIDGGAGYESDSGKSIPKEKDIASLIIVNVNDLNFLWLKPNRQETITNKYGEMVYSVIASKFFDFTYVGENVKYLEGKVKQAVHQFYQEME